MMEVSAGIVCRKDGRILICRRGEGRRNAHLWEFPGGKREKGESAEECLVRELQEELALPVTDVRSLSTRDEDGIRFTFLTAFTDASPVLTEHEDAAFVEPREMLRYEFCPADTLVAQQIAFSGVKHFIWDFDGTLVDTYPAMTRAFVLAAADYGVSITPERTLDLLKNCLHHALTTVSAESGVPVDELRKAFRAHEKDELRSGVPLVSGVREALEALHARGGRHYVCTHRDLVSRELLEGAGVLPLFDGFVTEENGLPRKPAPDMLLHLMNAHGLPAEACVMIGDRPLDTQAGQAAGMGSVLLDTEDRFPDGPCDLRLADPGQLAALFLQF